MYAKFHSKKAIQIVCKNMCTCHWKSDSK